MINQDKMRALAADLRKSSGGRYRWYAMGRNETSYFMDFDWGYDADRWFADQQRSRAAWIEQEGVHLVKKLFQTELETNAAAAADAIDLLLAEVEAAAADKREEPSLTNPLTPYGLLVRALRIVAGITLMDMATALLTTPAKLSAMEFGRTPVTPEFAFDVSAYFDALGVPHTASALRAAIEAPPLFKRQEKS